MQTGQCTIHIVSANLGRLLGPSLPEAVVQAARDHLRSNDKAGRLRGVWAAVFGDDLHLHLTTCNDDFKAGETPAAFVGALALGAARAALACGTKLGLEGPANHARP